MQPVRDLLACLDQECNNDANMRTAMTVMQAKQCADLVALQGAYLNWGTKTRR